MANAPAPAGRWWVWLIVIPLIAIVFFVGYRIVSGLESAKTSGADTAKSRAAHDLPVVVARVRRGDLDQYLVGLGTVTPLNTVTVKSRVDGAITKIWFTEGQTVKVGDKLIDIDPAPYEAAMAQAQGQLQKDEAALEGANWNVQADEEAIKTKGISEQQLRTDTATRDSDAGAVAVVGLRLVDLGNIVHASDTTGLVVITQLQPITVVFTVAEDDIAQVQKRVASGLPLVVDAYDRDLVQKLAAGKVLAIDNQIDPTTGTVKIKAQFDNQDNALYPSQFVNARMLVNTITNAVLVPSAAIQHSPNSTFAYVVVPDPSTTTAPSAVADANAPTTMPAKGSKESRIVTMRQVVTGPGQAAVGPDSEDTTVVVSGLKPGDIVVTDGVDKLQEGTKVIPTFADNSKGKSTTRPSTTMESTTQPTHGRHGHKPAE